MLEHWVWLSQRSGVSDRTRMELLRQFSSAEALYEADEEALAELPEEPRAALLDKDLKRACEVLAQCAAKGVRVLALGDAAYPERLRAIFDPPAVLYLLGELPELDTTAAVGVVGTRRPSAYGACAAWRTGYELAAGGAIVVSGLAAGVDGAAMTGALEAGGTVIGVLGCGIDQIYPRSNAKLFADTQRYGCIVSEYPPGTPPARWTFPKRNRIISGLSRGVVIVEAPEKSGSLITATHALEQGRDVFAVPGNVDMPGFVGSNRLLRDGAIAVSGGCDVLQEYIAQYPGKLHMPRPRPRQEAPRSVPSPAPEPVRPAEAAAKRAKKAASKPAPDKKSIDKPARPEYPVRRKPLPALSPEQEKLVACLEQGELALDELIAASGLETAKVMALLTVLEIRGVLVRKPGKRIALKNI